MSHVSVTQARHQGAEPTIKHNAPSWSCNKSLGQSKIRQRRTCKNLLKNTNIKENNQIYYSSQYEQSHNPSYPTKLSIATQKITKVPRSCEAAHEVSKVKAQRGEENITYLLVMDPWSKGDYSQHIREASMAMEGLMEVVLPSGRVPRQLTLAAPILKGS